MTLIENCRACGNQIDDDACYGCQTCPECMPGTCWACAVMRRENDTQWHVDYHNEGSGQ